MRAERHELATLGRRLRATRLPRPLERWLRGAWGSEPDPELPGECELDLTWRARARWRRVPCLEARRTATPAGVVLGWIRHDDRWWSTTFGAAGLELSLHANHARIQLWGDRWGDAEGLAGAQSAMLVGLHAAMCEALRSRGLVPMHASVIVRDGCATALLGASDARTGALLRAVQSGWLPLAQDIAWLEPASRRVRAWHGDRGLRVSRDAIPRLPEAWRAAVTRESVAGDARLPYETVAPSRSTVARLTRVVLLDLVDGAAATPDAVAPREAAMALWRSTGMPLCRFSQRSFADQVPTLVRDLEWARLVEGGGPLTHQ